MSRIQIYFTMVLKFVRFFGSLSPEIRDHDNVMDSPSKRRAHADVIEISDTECVASYFFKLLLMFLRPVTTPKPRFVSTAAHV